MTQTPPPASIIHQWVILRSNGTQEVCRICGRWRTSYSERLMCSIDETTTTPAVASDKSQTTRLCGRCAVYPAQENSWQCKKCQGVFTDIQDKEIWDASDMQLSFMLESFHQYLPAMRELILRKVADRMREHDEQN